MKFVKVLNEPHFRIFADGKIHDICGGYSKIHRANDDVYFVKVVEEERSVFRIVFGKNMSVSLLCFEDWELIDYNSYILEQEDKYLLLKVAGDQIKLINKELQSYTKGYTNGEISSILVNLKNNPNWFNLYSSRLSMIHRFKFRIFNKKNSLCDSLDPNSRYYQSDYYLVKINRKYDFLPKYNFMDLATGEFLLSEDAYDIIRVEDYWDWPNFYMVYRKGYIEIFSEKKTLLGEIYEEVDKSSLHTTYNNFVVWFRYGPRSEDKYFEILNQQNQFDNLNKQVRCITEYCSKDEEICKVTNHDGKVNLINKKLEFLLNEWVDEGDIQIIGDKAVVKVDGRNKIVEYNN